VQFRVTKFDIMEEIGLCSKKCECDGLEKMLASFAPPEGAGASTCRTLLSMRYGCILM
jgi:hypothetical protein